MENRRSMTLDFSKIRTYSAENRHNLVRIDNLKRPGQYQPDEWGGADFDALIGSFAGRGRRAGRSSSPWARTSSSAACRPISSR